jgi:hypothetical protein
MQTSKEFEVGVLLGKTYWKVLKIVVNKVSKDMYVILPIPYAGLHWSIHPPKSPIHPDWLIHVRSREELGIEEKVDLKLSAMLDYFNNFVERIVDAVKVRSLTNEKVLVMPPNLFSSYVEHQLSNKRKTMVDLGQMIRATSTGTFYRTRAKYLPHLIRKIKRQSPSISKDVNIFGLANDRVVIPITSKRMLEFDPHQLTEELSNIHPINAFFDPMQRAIERLKALRPSILQEWYPNNIARDLENFIEPLESSKPRIVDFPKNRS